MNASPIFKKALLTQLSGVGNKTAEILAKYEIKLVVDAALLDDNDIQTLCDELRLREEHL